MKHRKITGVLVDVNAGTVKQATIEANLDSYYKALDCTCIDIVVRKLGPYRFDIICDDEGLFRENARVSAFDPDNQPMLVGNLFFCRHDGEGRMVSLHPMEAELIISRTRPVVSKKTGEVWQAVVRLSY